MSIACDSGYIEHLIPTDLYVSESLKHWSTVSVFYIQQNMSQDSRQKRPVQPL